MTWIYFSLPRFCYLLTVDTWSKTQDIITLRGHRSLSRPTNACSPRYFLRVNIFPPPFLFFNLEQNTHSTIFFIAHIHTYIYIFPPFFSFLKDQSSRGFIGNRERIIASPFLFFFFFFLSHSNLVTLHLVYSLMDLMDRTIQSTWTLCSINEKHFCQLPIYIYIYTISYLSSSIFFYFFLFLIFFFCFPLLIFLSRRLVALSWNFFFLNRSSFSLPTHQEDKRNDLSKIFVFYVLSLVPYTREIDPIQIGD